MMYNKYIILFLLIFILFIRPVSAASEGYLIIPSINLYKTINKIPDSDLSPQSHFYDLDNLKAGVGYLEGLTWGTVSGGRTVLVGHNYGAFYDLNKVTIGDEIILSMGNDYYTFHVFEIYPTHFSDNTLFVNAPDSYELVLVTCIDEDMRLIVKAK